TGGTPRSVVPRQESRTQCRPVRDARLLRSTQRRGQGAPVAGLCALAGRADRVRQVTADGEVRLDTGAAAGGVRPGFGGNRPQRWPELAEYPDQHETRRDDRLDRKGAGSSQTSPGREAADNDGDPQVATVCQEVEAGRTGAPGREGTDQAQF